jgi:hypothetical protein
MVVAAEVITVDLVVTARDRAVLGTLDGDLEREQIGLAVRSRADDRIEPVAVGLMRLHEKCLSVEMTPSPWSR